MKACASERGEKMLYLEMAASQEQMMETRRQVEHNRLEASLAQARLSHEAALQENSPLHEHVH